MRESRVVRVAIGVGVFSLSACATVKNTMLRPDYGEADQKQTVRLVVVTSPLPDGRQDLGQLWAEVARHYANDHRDFLVKVARAAPTEPADLCAPGIEGVLHLTPLLVKRTAVAPSVDFDDADRDISRQYGSTPGGGGVEERLQASLSRCRDGTVIWSAESAGIWASSDPNLKDVAEHYSTSLGPAVRPYVAPAYHLLKPTLEALPQPLLDDKGKDEKIDMSD